MRILVLHAWLRGNLGDVLQLSVLLSALRELRPRVLHLAGHPAQPSPAAGELMAAVDAYLPDPFAWYWKLAPRIVARPALASLWRRRRKALFSQYDAIVCAPGPYLADYDARAPSALSDVAVARDLGLPVILSSHSIGPLPAEALAIVSRANVRVARESRTHEYLREHGIPSTLAADLAFLYPYERVPTGSPPASRYRLVFLRSNNLNARSLRMAGGGLLDGSRTIAEASSDETILATSDPRRDGTFIENVAGRLGIRTVTCQTVPELVQLVAHCSAVVSDRYHPAICAAVLGKPAKVLPNREPHKMHGLKDLLSGRSVQELQALARGGLDAALAGVRGVA
jgi:polysaccharide pyruvyl transferase WcaK-like protein